MPHSAWYWGNQTSFPTPLTCKIEISIQMPCPKNFCIPALKSLYFVNCATSNNLWKVWYTKSELHQKSAPISKKQPRIWIRTGRVRWANVLKLPNSNHSGAHSHQLVLTSNLFSDIVVVLNHVTVVGSRRVCDNLQPFQ